MATVNEQILDDAIRRQLDLQGYSNAVVAKVIALLNRVDADLLAQLANLDVDAADWSIRRLESALAAVRQINADAYRQSGDELHSQLRELTAYEVGYQHQLFAHHLPVSVALSGVAPAQVYAAAMARPFQGVLLREALAGLESDRAARVRDAIRMGFVEGQTNAEIIQRIAGTKANGYADGLMEIDRRNCEAMVRTAINHTANYSRQAFYEANTDVVKAWQFHATLDGRTTLQCAALDGKVFDLGKGPMPPRHYRCRSTSVPVMKSWQELGIDLPDAPPSTRASMDGQVAGDMTFGQWIKDKPASFQDDVLGPTRGRLFRDGKMPLTSFVNNAGREYTLDELRKRDAAAFKRAGL